VVVPVGQDGLVANVAKYLDRQPVLGVNPAPDLYDGVLVRVAAGRLAALLPASVAGAAAIERRTMVQASLDSGETLVALNEIFVGHRSHQSARYRIETDGEAEDHSSSGLIVASGTGATGWARSIAEATHLEPDVGPRGTRGRLLGARAVPEHCHQHQDARRQAGRYPARRHVTHE
jgi:NAD kinase